MSINPPSQDEEIPAGNEQEQNQAQTEAGQGVSNFWEKIVRLGLGESALRVGASVVSIALFLVVIWIMATFYLKAAHSEAGSAAAAPTAEENTTSGADVAAPVFDVSSAVSYDKGITRLADLHTTLPSHPRFEVIQYEVQKGDTLFAIAEKFALKPETLLWGNSEILGDDPHRLTPGQKLNILPVDGVYYQWHDGDGLNGVAKYLHVTPEDIIDWPSNNLTKESVGDYANPNIKAGTWLVIPGGSREFVTWSAPRITRDNPGVAKILGPGACGVITEGAVGTGTFIWPTTDRTLSGYDYSPSTNHFGIDIAGDMGYPIYAADNGVVVYSGWNDWGYGNVIVIDHGNGWQTLYAHLSVVGVGCGASVYQGGQIGSMGSTGNSTGPHLHFEMLSDQYGKVNPWNFLQ